jgi:hypothetical protein
VNQLTWHTGTESYNALYEYPSLAEEFRNRRKMMTTKACFAATGLALGSLVLAAPALADPVVVEATGEFLEDIQDAVDDFRQVLGDDNGVGGSFGDGRREINWDAVPVAFAAPNLLPPDFFNLNSPRGVVFFTPGTGFQVSADSDNPTQTEVRFGNIRRNFPNQFSTFSPERLFTALDSNIVEVLFFLPETSISSTVDGFGVIFTDVDREGSTRIEYLDVNGSLLFSQDVLRGPTRRGSLSFLGVAFDGGERVFLVRITSGNRILRVPADDPVAMATLGQDPVASSERGRDEVVMDDFIYGEPQRLSDDGNVQ